MSERPQVGQMTEREMGEKHPFDDGGYGARFCQRKVESNVYSDACCGLPPDAEVHREAEPEEPDSPNSLGSKISALSARDFQRINDPRAPLPSTEKPAEARTDRRYRSKVVEIEAMQWDGSRASIEAICQWVNRECPRPPLRPGEEDSGEPIISFICETMDDVRAAVIWTWEGDMVVSPDDWVIRGLEGEFYPCKPAIFAKKYEPLASPPPQAQPSGLAPAKEWGCDQEERAIKAEAEIDRLQARLAESERDRFAANAAIGCGRSREQVCKGEEEVGPDGVCWEHHAWRLERHRDEFKEAFEFEHKQGLDLEGRLSAAEKRISSFERALAPDGEVDPEGSDD
jgi:hypothetical protein